MKYTLKAVLTILSALVALIFITHSCKKSDIVSPDVQVQNLTEKFFSTKTTPIKEVAEVIEKLKQENERTDFVNKLPKNCGLPVWDKIAIQKEANSNESFYSPAKHGPSASFENSESSYTHIIIPLTINYTNLSSIIIVDVIDDSTIINCYTTNDYLYNITHAETLDTTVATQQLALFFYMENRTFETTTFYHIPANLFSHSITLDADGNKTITIKDDTTTNSIVWICITYICSICHGNDPNCPLGGSWTICTPIGGGGGTGGGGTGGGGNGGGSGGGGGGSGGGGGGGGNPCPFTGGAWYNFVPDDCGPNTPPVDTLIPAQILQLLKDENEAIKYRRDSVWSVALDSNYEHHFFIKKTGANFQVLGITTDRDSEGVTPNRVVEANSNPDGDYHTHQDANPLERHLHDPQDILNSNIWHRKLYYRSYVDCGDTLYVVVNENLNKIKQFLITNGLKTLQNSQAWQNLSSAGNNRRSLGISLLLGLLGNSTVTGLGLYKTTNAAKTEFIKVN